MSAEYTPTTDEVRAVYGEVISYGQSSTEWAQAASRRTRAFDRWLAAHDAEVAARAVRHAVPLAVGSDGYAIRQRLLERADQIEEGVA